VPAFDQDLKRIAYYQPTAMKYIPTLTWYLEMTEQPAVHTALPEGFSIEEYLEPGVEEYLSVYNAVGEKYNWFDRLLMPKEQVKEIIDSAFTRIILLKYRGIDNPYPSTSIPGDSSQSLRLSAETPHPMTPTSETAGFAELNLSVAGEIEIVYFGLTDKFTGRRAGFPFLMQVIEMVWNLPHKPWDEKINRVWLHTCDLDHPAALPLYQKAGFVVYKSEMIMQPVMPGNQ
jgi:hypothetical protein